MAERVAGPEIERLVQLLARLPGLGPRSARRAVLHLIRKREELLAPLADAMRIPNAIVIVREALASELAERLGRADVVRVTLSDRDGASSVRIFLTRVGRLVYLPLVLLRE